MTTDADQDEAVSLEQSIAENLRDVRERLRLTQGEVARRMTSLGAKKHTTQIAKLESGDLRVNAVDLLRLAAVLGVRPSRIVCGADPDKMLDVFPGVPSEDTGVLGQVSRPLQFSARVVRRWFEGHLVENPLLLFGSGGPGQLVAYSQLAADDVTLARRYSVVVAMTELMNRLEQNAAENDPDGMLEVIDDMLDVLAQQRRLIDRGEGAL